MVPDHLEPKWWCGAAWRASWSIVYCCLKSVQTMQLCSLEHCSPGFFAHYGTHGFLQTKMQLEQLLDKRKRVHSSTPSLDDILRATVHNKRQTIQRDKDSMSMGTLSVIPWRKVTSSVLRWFKATRCWSKSSSHSAHLDTQLLDSSLYSPLIFVFWVWGWPM